MKTLYIISPSYLSADSGEIDYAIYNNLKTSIVSAVDASYSVFNSLVGQDILQDKTFDYGEYRRLIVDWVKYADCCLMLEGSIDCPMAWEEMTEASLHGVPCFDRLYDILNWEFETDPDKEND